MMPTVYLAGPISGLTFAEATRERDRFEEFFSHHSVDVRSPMRDKKPTDNPDKVYEADMCEVLTDKAVVTRDRTDVHWSDCILVDMRGAKTVSIGTCFEIAWAWEYDTPVVLLMEDAGNPNEHMFVDYCSHFRTSDPETAADLVLSILNIKKLFPMDKNDADVKELIDVM